MIVGKRITVGAAINSVAATLAHIFPDYAPAIISIAVPITFLVQIWIANKMPITLKEPPK